MASPPATGSRPAVPACVWRGDFGSGHSLAVVNDGHVGALEAAGVAVERLARRDRPSSSTAVGVAGHWPPSFEAPSAGIAARLAAAVGGKAFSEKRFDSILRASRADLGTGRHVRQPVKVTKVELAPYVSLAALLPLSLLLWRRNL